MHGIVVCSCGWSKLVVRKEYCSMTQSLSYTAIAHRAKHKREKKQVTVYVGLVTGEYYTYSA